MDSNRCTSDFWRSAGCSRLTAAGQILQPSDTRRRIPTFFILRSDRPLPLQQRPFGSDGPHQVSIDSFPARRPALLDPERAYGQVPQSRYSICSGRQVLSQHLGTRK
jgi:hypothetical protein